jgi:PAS domain S-box-containing protein
MEYSFKELIDIPKLQKLTDELYKASSIPSAIIAIDGEVLTGSGWQKICTDFHRQHPQTLKDCIKSDTTIRKKLEEGDPFAIYKCPRGLVDASSPIIIDGEHVANAFAGQIFLESPDKDKEHFFKEQAQEFGFDEAKYLKALKEVPIFQEKKFKSALFFLSKLSEMIADMGLTRMREIKAVEMQKKSEFIFSQMFEQSMNSTAFYNPEGTIIKANKEFCKMFGVKEKAIIDAGYNVFKDQAIINAGVMPDLKAIFNKKKTRNWQIDFDIETASTSTGTPTKKTGKIFLEIFGYPVLNHKENIEYVVLQHYEITARKQAEFALEESKEKYRTLFERESDAIFIYDPDTTNILDANQSTSKIYGYHKDELIGMSCMKFSAEVKKSEAAMKEIYENGEVFVPHRLHCKKDGTVFPVTISGYEITIGDKKVMYAVSKDISKQKLAEDKLLKNQYYLSKAQEIGKIGTWELDIKKNEILWTDENYRIFGIPIGTKLTYESFLNCVHPDDREYVETEFKASILGKDYDIEHRLLIDGKIKWVREKAELKFNEKSECIQATGFTQDITDRHLSSIALQKSNERFKKIFHIQLDAIFILNKEVPATILECNQAASDIFGYKSDELIGKTVEQLHIDSSQMKIFHEHLFPAIKQKGYFRNFEFSMKRKDGAHFPSEHTVLEMKNNSGDRIGWVSMVRDLSEIKRAKNALIDSEGKFRTLFENAPLSYQSLDKNGNFIEVNDTWLNVLGYKRHEIIGKNFSEFLHPDWKDHFRENFPRFKAVGEVLGVEFEIVKKDGDLILVSFHGKIGKDKYENFKQTHCIFQDITERKKTDTRLQKYSHDLSERVKELNCLHEISKLIEKKNISFDSLFQGIVDIIPPALQYPDITCSRIFIDGQEYKTENFQKTKTYQKKDIFVHGDRVGILEVYQLVEKSIIDEEPFLKEENDLINVITERLGRIAERRQNTHDTQAIMESTVGKTGQNLFDFIVIRLCEWLKCDCAIIGEIINGSTVKALAMVMDDAPVSDYAYNLKGSPCAEATSNSYCVYTENVSTLFPDDPDLIEMGADGYVGVSLEDKTGKAIGVLCGISRKKLHLTKQTQNIMKIIGTRISTELERMRIENETTRLRAQLHQAQKMESIGTLAGGIAHDFNNILFPILGYTEMLLEDVPTDSPFRPNLEDIYASSLRAKDLVKQILTFSRQEKTDLKLMKMQTIIKEALKLIRSSIPTTIEIEQNIQTDCGVIKADPTQIHQIIMNLATNAYHAMEKIGGKLKVSLQEVEIGEHNRIGLDTTPGNYAHLTIADNGVGMDKSILQKIFEPFYTTKEMGKGTGMGLSVVHGIVKNINGTIQVSSEPDQGTQFHIYLPVVTSFLKKQEFQRKSSIVHGTERILLVDDEKAILDMESKMLQRMGYLVTSRTSSIEALEAFRANPNNYDLVITDMAMPNMPGDILANELIKIRPDIPIMLCTGFSETSSNEKVASSGIKGFLMKPIVMKELSQKIREVLDGN